MSSVGSITRRVEPADLGPVVSGGMAVEYPPAAPLSLAARKAAALALLDELEAEARATESAPLALAVRRADRLISGINQLTGKPSWA